MPEPFSVLKLTDGKRTVNFLDNVNYSLVSYAPRVAPRRLGRLGGRGPYADVDESIIFNVYGDTAASALAALQLISQLLEQAQAFAEGEKVDPVVLELRTQGSALGAALKSLVLGLPEGAAPLELPVTFNDMIGVYEIESVVAQLKRRGLWTLEDFDVENHLLNASFEEWSGGVPVGWISSNSPTITQEENFARHGDYGVRLANPSTQNYRGVYQDVSGLSAGQSYTAHVWVYLHAALAARLLLTDGGGFANGVAVTANSLGWQQLVATKVAPAGGSIRVTLAAYDPASDATFDTVMLELGASATSWHLADKDYLENTSALAGRAASGRYTVQFMGGDLRILSPLDVELGDIGPTPTDTLLAPAGYLLIASQEEHITKLEAEDMTLAGGSVQAEIDASGGEVARFTGATAGSAKKNLTTTDVGGGRQLAVFAMVRKNTMADVWTLQAQVYREGSEELNNVAGELVYLDDVPASVTIEVVPLGVVTRSDQDFTLKVEATRLSGSGTLDIDTVAILAVDDETSRALGLLKIKATEADAMTHAHQFGVRTGALDSLAPEAYLSLAVGGDLTRHGYRGDAFLVARGDTVVAMWLATDGANWYHEDQGTGDAAELQLTARRYPSFLVPQ